MPPKFSAENAMMTIGEVLVFGYGKVSATVFGVATDPCSETDKAVMVG